MSVATASQRELALAHANEVRQAMAAVKRDVAAGLPFAEALEDERAQSLQIGVLLLSLPRWGTVRMRKTLAHLLINEHRRVRDLTENQKTRLLRVGKGPGNGV